MEDIHQLLIKVAYYYYRKGLTQGEIADKLMMSRQRVNRLIKRVWEDGVVSISINGLSESYVELESKLEEKYNLKRAVVIPNPNFASEDLLRELSIAGGNYLLSMLSDNLTVGVAWGRTLYNLGTHLTPTSSYNGLSVIQLVGSLNMEDALKQSDEITRIVSQKLNAQPYFIYAPTYINNEVTKDVMLSEDSIKLVFDKMKTCDIILYSIGEVGGIYSSFKKVMMSKEELETIKAKAVGNICMWYFDNEGNIIDLPLHNRLMGIDIDTLKKVPEVICIAGGKEKENAILGGLRGGMMNTLITDYNTAINILEKV